MNFHLEGIFPALLTPFTKGGVRVDYSKACKLAGRLAHQGVHGLFVCGTTGEGPLLTVDERKKLLEEVVRAVGKRIKIIAHTGCFDTATTIELTRHAQKTGAVAAGVIAPGFFTLDDISLAAHFKSVANAVKDYPIFLYNLPSCAKNALSPELVAGLAKSVKNIAGMKDSGGSLQVTARFISETPRGFNVINGCDEFSFQAYLTGANGSVSSTANVTPELFLGIFNAVKAGKIDEARKIQVQLSKACGLFQYGRMVAYYKEGLRLRGGDAGSVRSPQRELSADEKKAFAKALHGAGLI
ncbi:MAG: dihydrodipicolinate synthase family protein [Candidatus Hydrogenedentes bacterium]|nr:dihydrodipicolinate synthase family protein [Candidatus Hydrogenedentota bacterium]